MREAVEDHGGNQKRWNFSESNKKGYVRELAEARDRAGVKRARPAPPASAKLLKIFQWIREGCEFGWGLRAKGHHEIWVVKPFCGAWGSVREGKKVDTQKTMYLFL